jgi:hypothetical protein
MSKFLSALEGSCYGTPAPAASDTFYQMQTFARPSEKQSLLINHCNELMKIAKKNFMELFEKLGKVSLKTPPEETNTPFLIKADQHITNCIDMEQGLSTSLEQIEGGDSIPAVKSNLVSNKQRKYFLESIKIFTEIKLMTQGVRCSVSKAVPTSPGEDTSMNTIYNIVGKFLDSEKPSVTELQHKIYLIPIFPVPISPTSKL